jgi:hypothetical protein
MVFIEPIAPLVDTLHTQCFHGFACAAPQDQANPQRRTPSATAKLCVHRTKVVLARVVGQRCRRMSFIQASR